MKKRKIIIPLIIVILIVLRLVACRPEEVCLNYNESSWVNGFVLFANDRAKCAFAGYYDCEEYTEGMDIYLPDEFMSYPVTRLGGYFGRGVPTPFCIILPDSYGDVGEYGAICVYKSESLNTLEPGSYTVQNMLFNLHIGKNLKTIEYVDMDSYRCHTGEDGRKTFYHPVVYITCSEENKHFYSVDGKLYNKKTGELIDVFAYSN